MSAGENRAGRRLPLACSLSGQEEAGRRDEVEKILEACLRVDELEDGYEFRFPGSAEWTAKLTEFIVFERECCPFFAFELVFEPGGGPIGLRVRGAEGAKEFVAEMAALQAR
jgi:hypothetical protein